MAELTSADWLVRSQLYSFLANSFLKVMTAESSLGLDPGFWLELAEDAQLSHATDNKLRPALVGLSEVAQQLSDLSPEKAVERVAVEYTRLFIGPPEPAAPPWETLYRQGGTVLFGQPTFDMRQLLAQEGYQASKEAHQFEDHLGFELLYLALRADRFAGELEADPSIDQTAWAQEQASFINAHPLSFIDAMREKAAEAGGVGYYVGLLDLTKALLDLDASSGVPKQ